MPAHPKLFTFLFFLLCVLNCERASATIYFEPYGAFGKGGYKSTFVEQIPDFSDIELTSKGKSSGALFGGRIGFGGDTFALGFDYGDIKYWIKSEGGIKDSYEIVDRGVFLNWNIATFLRLYGTYIISSKFRNMDNDWKSHGVKVGLGIMPMDFVSLNFEYIAHGYTQEGTEDTPFGPSNWKAETTDSLFFVGLSFPVIL
jgi:hypothetical protein